MNIEVSFREWYVFRLNLLVVEAYESKQSYDFYITVVNDFCSFRVFYFEVYCTRA